MIKAQYTCGLIYFALHRLLRWRQTDYDPAAHLGGICTYSSGAWPAKKRAGRRGAVWSVQLASPEPWS